jgi:hypothetical protein
MEWITKSKLSKWIILVFFVINLITITIMWTYILKDKQPPPAEFSNRPEDPVKLLQKELNLSSDQTKQFEEMRNKNIEQMQKLIEQLDGLENQLSARLFNVDPDSSKINSLTQEIGSILGKMEKSRYNHFKEFISICSSDQKEKLKPILKGVIERNPPLKDLENGRPRSGNNDEQRRPPMTPGNKPQPFNGPERM